MNSGGSRTGGIRSSLIGVAQEKAKSFSGTKVTAIPVQRGQNGHDASINIPRGPSVAVSPKMRTLPRPIIPEGMEPTR